MVELNTYLLAFFKKPHSKISFATLEEGRELVSSSSEAGVNACSRRPRGGGVGGGGISLAHGGFSDGAAPVMLFSELDTGQAHESVACCALKKGPAPLSALR